MESLEAMVVFVGFSHHLKFLRWGRLLNKKGATVSRHVSPRDLTRNFATQDVDLMHELESFENKKQL